MDKIRFLVYESIFIAEFHGISDYWLFSGDK